MLRALFYITLPVVVAIITIFSAYCYVPEPVIIVSNAKSLLFKVYFPQGWGFFTRDPTKNRLGVFEVADGRLKEKNLLSRGNPYQNVLGFSRHPRRLNYEFTSLMRRLKEDQYKLHEGDISIDSMPVVEFFLYEPHNIKMIKEGQYCIQVEDNIPWSWSKNFRYEYIKKKSVLIDITYCL